MTNSISRRTFLGSMGAVGICAAGSALADDSAAPKKSGIIDCHVHLKHGDAARTEWSADAIVEIMDQVGIQRSVVFGMSTTTARSIEMAQAAVQKYPDRLIPFLYALPSYERPVVKEIETAISEQGFRG